MKIVTNHSLKLNVDGNSFRNPGRVSFDGPIHNTVGGWIYDLSGLCGCASNLMAELYVILNGLQLAWIKAIALLFWNQIPNSLLILFMNGT